MADLASVDWPARPLATEQLVLRESEARDNSASVRVAVKVGFIERDRFEEYGAEQWFGVWLPPSHRF